MNKYINCLLNPLDVEDNPWLYEDRNIKKTKFKSIGKWMLFYDKKVINEKWFLAKKLYIENKLNGIVSMKCSTNYKNPRSSSNDSIIIFYCYYSCSKENILEYGKNIITMMKYTDQQTIYFKTDEQTYEGTRSTGCENNHLFELNNHLYKYKRLLKPSNLK